MKRLGLIEPEAFWLSLLTAGFVAICYATALQGRAEAAPSFGSLVTFTLPQGLLFSRARSNDYSPYSKFTYLVVNECFLLAMATIVAIVFWMMFIQP